MSTESRASGRWMAVSFVVLAAAAFALLFRAGETPPTALGGPVAVEVPPAAGAPPADLVPEASPDTSPAGQLQVGFDWPEGPELERTYELATGEPFELTLDSGNVRVLPVGGSTARVRVSLVGGTRPPVRFEWTATRDEDATRLRIRSQDSRSWFSRLFRGEEKDEVEILVEGRPVKVSNKRARVGEVWVELPADSPLFLHSGAGDLSVSDRSANVSVDSGAGDVRLERVAASVEVDTGAGDVHLEDIAGDATIDSGAGEVTATGVLGKLDVDTGAGSVSFAGAPASVAIDTGAGGVEGELDSLRGDVDIDTGMGGITLRLPFAADGQLMAESGLGSVSAEIEGTRLSAARGEALTATIGKGGPRIQLRTGTGSIRVSEGATPNSN